jgi:catechol 2,3-dioxygenase-like lactoylglutathione lyase family enzyme
MSQYIAYTAIVVDDYDKAIAYFTQALRFELLEDTVMSAEKRWVRIAPRGSEKNATGFLLARAANEKQSAAIGNQFGGRVGFFLHTDDFDNDYAHMLQYGVKFTEQPRFEEYGKVVVFEDLYGNRWDFIEPKILMKNQA